MKIRDKSAVMVARFVKGRNSQYLKKYTNVKVITLRRDIEKLAVQGWTLDSTEFVNNGEIHMYA